MKRTAVILGFALAAAVSVVCERGGIDVASETERLLQTDREFAQASIDLGAAEAFRRYLSEDAVMFSSGRNPVHGRGSIYEIMKQGSGAYELRWEPQAGEVAGSGEMGYTWGLYTFVEKGEGGATSYGKYVNVWKRDDDGNWRVLIDIGNESPPPAKDKEVR
jgi:ketosteroid isomerase-like protein